MRNFTEGMCTYRSWNGELLYLSPDPSQREYPRNDSTFPLRSARGSPLRRCSEEDLRKQATVVGELTFGWIDLC